MPAQIVPLQNDQAENGRPIAEFHPSIWGDLFLNYTPDDEATHSKKEKDIKQLKEEVKKELFASAQNPFKQLSLIDAIQRLGVAYHLEEELEEILLHMFNTFSGHDHAYNEDGLYNTSLCFRIMRQHGFYISCDIFEKFTNGKRKFKDSLTSDVEGLLSLYEASHVRIHGEDVLDEALEFTTMHLNSMANNLNGLMAQEVNHALNQPLHKGMTRLESRYYISMYEHHPLHNKTLLEFAKLDFNFLQSLHKKELKDIARWWKDILSSYRFARDRLAEAYFWTLADVYEPQYSLARKIFSKIFLVTSIIDDIYDAYGMFDELELFTELIHRWDKSCINQLPDYMKFVYEALLDTFKEIEQDLAQEQREHLVPYVIEQMIILCDTYLQEARWRHEKCIPSYDEYVKNSGVSFGYDLGIQVSFLGMGEIATKEAFEWVRKQPKPVVATGVMGRLKNDMGGTKFQQCRDHVASAVECYMKEYGVSEEEAREKLNKQVEDAWKDINEGMLRPYALPKPLLARIIELSRLVDVIYKGEDGYTTVSKTIKNKIELVLVDQVPL